MKKTGITASVLCILCMVIFSGCLSFFWDGTEGWEEYVFTIDGKETETVIEIDPIMFFFDIKVEGEIRGKANLFLIENNNASPYTHQIFGAPLSGKIKRKGRSPEWYQTSAVVRVVPENSDVRGTIQFYHRRGYRKKEVTLGTTALIPVFADYIPPGLQCKRLTAKKIHTEPRLSNYEDYIEHIPDNLLLLYEYAPVPKHKNKLEQRIYAVSNNKKELRDIRTINTQPLKNNFHSYDKHGFKRIYLQDIGKEYIFNYKHDNKKNISTIYRFDNSGMLLYKTRYEETKLLECVFRYTAKGHYYKFVYTKHDEYGNWLEAVLFYNDDQCNASGSLDSTKPICTIVREIEYESEESVKLHTFK